MKESKGVEVTGRDALGLWWVNLAVTKDETRYAIMNIEVKNGNANGTDGRRLHRYKLEEPIPEGLYKPLISRKTKMVLVLNSDISLRYPDTDTLQMKNPMPGEVEQLPLDLDQAIAKLNRKSSSRYCINSGHLNDAMKAGDVFMIWGVPTEGRDSIYYLKSESMTAIIMPKMAQR